MEAKLALDYGSVLSVLSGLVEVGLVVVNGDGELDFASDRARTLLGCEGHLSLESCYPAARDAIRDAIHSIEPHDQDFSRRQIQFEADGVRREISLEAHPIDEDACSGYLVLVKDEDNMRKMATDLGLAAQFRNARRLYRAVVQDLKQPISAVMLHADLVRERVSPSDGNTEPSTEARSLGIIKSQITELNHALTLLLEEIEPADTEERGFSLRDVIDDVRRLVEPLAASQAVELDVSVSEHAARLSGNRQRVKQAILNLAVNALDAMPEGGILRIDLTVSGDQAEIVVADTGVGIPPEVVPHIFEMHFTTKETGTGVGLYVARDVIKKHGGHITLDTSGARGTTFRVALPVSENGS